MASYQDDDVVIVDAYRTPIGCLNGVFGSLRAHDLGGIVIKKLLNETCIKAEDVSEVIMGQVLPAGEGQNPARQASVSAGIPYTVPSYAVSFVCGSGLKAVVNAYQSIKHGDASIIIAGGQESMSNAPHVVHVRKGTSLGDYTLKDSVLHDGLTDAFYDYHMGITAENVAKQCNISREEQDKFAANSQYKVGVSQKEGYFQAEIIPVEIKTRKDSKFVSVDEFPRPDTTVEKLSSLRPCFDKVSGTVTAGNACGLNDGAAAVLLTTGRHMKLLNTKHPMARIVSWAQVGIDPAIMGTAPIGAVRKALEKAQWCIDDIDLVELNEAFAAQSLAVIRELNLPMEKVNVCGGSIGLGHPIGASGCRILVTLLHSMSRLNKKKGVATLCIGGGMGIAICVERL